MNLINGVLGLNYAILLLLVIVALAAIRNRNLLVSAIFLAIFSLLMATEYLLLGAPDVAITEAAVGAGISTILLLLALFHVGDEEKASANIQLLPLLVVSVMAGLLIYITVEMPKFGNPYTPASLHVSPYYLEVSSSDIGIPNVVTSILASYRGFDTLGETVVIFTAAVAVLLLLKTNKGAK